MPGLSHVPANSNVIIPPMEKYSSVTTLIGDILWKLTLTFWSMVIRWGRDGSYPGGQGPIFRTELFRGNYPRSGSFRYTSLRTCRYLFFTSSIANLALLGTDGAPFMRKRHYLHVCTDWHQWSCNSNCMYQLPVVDDFTGSCIYKIICKHDLCWSTIVHTFIKKKKKKGKRKVQGVPQSQTAALPRHQEEEETDKSKQAQIEQTYEKH